MNGLLKKLHKSCLLCCVAATVLPPSLLGQGASAARPWMNKALTADQRASAVLHEMTLEEKLGFVHGIGWGPLRAGAPVPADNNGGAGEVPGIPRLGIPSLQQADSAVGIRMAASESRYATLLPSTLGLAASWDTDGAFLYGDVIGRELRAQGYNQSIGGGVNLARDPRNGRLFEYGGEDPVLAGTMVGNLIRGVQSNAVMADIKHFAFNDQETGRSIVNVLIDKKAARESDLLAFELGIRIGQPSSVMCSYNKVNGNWACENDWLLNQVLKKDWKYPGFVVSDWEATHSAARAANAGLDLEQPGEDFFGGKLKGAVEQGSVTQARLDDMVRRILRSMFAAGVIDRPSVPRTVVDPFRGREDAQRLAEESIVLLRNKGNILPLSGDVHSIAVIGAHADIGIMSGGGSAQVDAPGGNALDPQHPTQWGKPVYFRSAPLRYIREHAPQASVVFDPGTDPATAAKLAGRSDVAIVFADQYMSEGKDSLKLALPGRQDDLISAVAAANPKTIVVLVTGNPVTMPWLNSVSGVLAAWYPGIAGGEAIANILFGVVNPSGKLPISFPRTEEDLPNPQVFGVNASEGEGGLPENWSKERSQVSFDAPLREGARVGYKWFDSESKQPLFPFGFGLSYTQFRYSALKIDKRSHSVSFLLANTGRVAGTEIAEVYLQLPPASREKFRRLAGWQRVHLGPGEEKAVTVPIEPLSAAVFETEGDRWQWLPGTYVVSAGPSSRELPLSSQDKLW